MKRDSQLDNCWKLIEELRQKMIAAALANGMDHPKVLWYSQQIDEQHNIILREQMK